MSKYSEHFKLTAITAYLEGSHGFRKVAQHFGIDFSLLRRWVAIYQTHTSASLRSTGQRYSTAFKLNVLAHRREHRLSLRQTAAHFGLGQSSQIGIWERQYYSDRPTALITVKRRMPVKVPKKIIPVEPTDTDDALKSR
ncbi:transposase, partial [Pseudomonas sp. SBB6]|uniref:transposase n=1 Tax=Pseudomonas sp. SBB6 TaxID=2962032 RepID=UPI0020B89A5A